MAFFDLARRMRLRIIDIEDKIDTGDSIFPAKGTAELLSVLTNSVSESQNMRSRLCLEDRGESTVSYKSTKAKKVVDVLNMYLVGMPIEQIHAMSGVSRSTIFRLLHRQNITLKTKTHYNIDTQLF